MKKHIFLTGQRQIGKSTAINRFLETASTSTGEPGGFRTIGIDLPEGGSNVHIVSASAPRPNKSNIVMYRPPQSGAGKTGFMPTIYTDTFDEEGVRLLKKSRSSRLILMDELGFAESRAQDFILAVLDALNGDIPVLGVTRAQDTEFLNKVRNHPNVRSVTVTRENRDDIPAMLIDWFASLT